MALINSKQIQFPLSGSFSGSFYGNGYGLDISRIHTGSIQASVGVDTLFLIKSGSNNLLEISNNADFTISSNLFIIKNYTSNQPIFTVSESIVKFATHSVDPSGNTDAGSIYFTSASFYVGLE